MDHKEIIKVIAYSFHYLFSGFQKVLPWTRCDAWWNSANTKEFGLYMNFQDIGDNIGMLVRCQQYLANICHQHPHVYNISHVKAECAIINSGELTADQLNCRIANETDGLIRLVFQSSTDGQVTVFQNVDIKRDSQFLEIKSNNC